MNGETARDDRWRTFDRTLAEVRDALADLTAEALQAMVDEACSQVRQELMSAGWEDNCG